MTVSVGGGTATSGTDYTAVADFKLTIAATESTGTGTFMLTPTQDSVSEGNETIDVTGTAGGFTVTQAEMTLTDDETAPGTIALTTAPSSVAEDDSATEVTVTATLGGSVTLSGATEVTVSVGGGSATSGTDYTAVENFKLTIAATESTGTGTFMLTPTQDSVSEGNETIDVTGAASGFTVTQAEMTLTDDETAPTAIALTTAPSSVGEDDSATEVTVTATLGGSVTLASATEVTVSVGGGTATSGTDYTAVENFKLTIAATESSGTGTFTLTPTQDSISEDDETIDVTGAAGGITVTKAEMTLTDDETAPTAIALTTAPSSVAEDDSATEVTVTATLGGSVTLSSATEVTVSVGGGSATSGTDYTAVENFKLTIAATESSGTGTFTLTPTQDSISEDDETIDVTGTAGGFTVTRAEMTLTDDDQPATTQIALELDPGTVPEGAGATVITLTARLSPDAQAAPTEVTVSVTGDTAMAGTDFAAVADFKLTIAARQTTGTASFMLTPVPDDVDEPDETLAVSGVTAAPELPVTPATLTLGDDDERGVTVQPTELHMRPGEHKSYTVRLSSQPTATATVQVIVPADRAADLTIEPATLTFTPAMWQTPQTVGVTASRASDAVASALRLELEHAVSGGDYDQMPAEPVALSISDDATTDAPQPDAPPPPPRPAPPPPPAVSISADAATVEEGTPARFTVTRSRATANPLTVTVGVTERGSFIAGAPPTQVTIAARARNATLLVATDDDSIDEPDGAVTATLAAGAGYGLGGSASATVTIADNDAAPEFTVADVRAVESAGQLEFTVELSAVSGWQVTVAYATAGRTATEDEDYTATSGMLTFATGQPLAQTIAVAVTDDTLDETDETFALLLSGARQATLAGGAATLAAMGTIEDDDEPAVSIAAAAATVAEGNAARFTVTRHGITAEPLTVAVAVTETGSVIAGEVAGEVTIAANARTATLLVATEDDATDEPDGTVTAAVMAGAGYVTVVPETATVTVADDDAAPELTIADVRAVESTGEIVFTVRMAAASGHRVTVTCTSEDGTARAEEDYGPEDGALTLAPGQTSGTIRVALLDDMVDEADETFTMVLTDAVNARLVDRIAVGTIEDDDPSVAQAWLARFGRTVATHVMEAIDGRLSAGMGQGAQATVAGRRLEPATGVARLEGAETVPNRTLELRELLAGSSFHLALATVDESADESGAAAGARWSAWGRGGATQFAGAQGGLSVGGEVASGVVGADYDWGRLVTGLSVAYSDGGGEFTVRGPGTLKEHTGDLQSWLLSAHPYASLKLTERLEVWGLLGYGLGRLSLAAGEGTVETDIALLMGAFAGRGLLLSRAQNGVELTVKSDGVMLQVTGEEAAGLPAVTADVQRVRLVLEGAVDAVRGPAGVLTPSLQVGARYDGGAAETGAGLEVGGGVSYAYPAWGLTLAASGRLLVTHQDRGYEEWGAGGSLRLQPGAAGLGPSLSVNTAWGKAASGVEQLWSQGAGSAAGGAGGAPAGRLAAELGYGIAAPGGEGLVTPYAGVTLANGGAPAYRVGGRMSLGQSFSLELQVDRREAAGAAPEHGLKLNASLRW